MKGKSGTHLTRGYAKGVHFESLEPEVKNLSGNTSATRNTWQASGAF